VLQLALLAFSMILQSQDAPPKSPDGGDILRGPEVPQDALKPDRTRKPAAAQPEKLSRPALEQQVFNKALGAIPLDEARRRQVDALRDEFVASVAAYEKEADARRKAIFEKRRKSAEPGQPPSQEFRKAMEELEAKRPKLADLKVKLAAVLSKEEMEALRKAYEEGLKRTREEITLREEEERRKREEARKSGGEPMKPGDGKKE